MKNIPYTYFSHSCVSTKIRGTKGLLLSALALSAASSPAAAQSNGYSENSNWRFETTADRAYKGSVRQLIEIKKADGYTSMNNYDIHYNIDGDYINCSVSSNVSGNQGTIDQFAPIGSPTLTSTPSFSSSATGNSNSASIGSDQGQSGTSPSDLVPVAIIDGSLTNGGTPVSGSDQSVSDSQLTSGVSDNASGFDVGHATGHGGNGSVVLNSVQSNDGATLSASLSDSQACAFSRVTGNGASNGGQ